MVARSPGSAAPDDARTAHARIDHARVARRLSDWFASAARDLPWRRVRDGYRALVSELMLQQTQVARVVEKFESFVARFPTPAALAAAREDDVLALWQGLGYYRRARLLHAAARAVVDRHGGEVPEDPEDLRALPGVGRYTAGAVASIAFGRRAAIVDGNVTRVLQRLAGREGRANDPEVVAWAWAEAEAFAATSSAPGVANEALMELGATVCTPAAPRCEGCPLRGACAARAAGRVGEIPAPKNRPARRELVLVTSVVRRADGSVLLEQRPRGGLWGGLWQPPTVESADGAALGPGAAAELLALPATVALHAGDEVPFATTHRQVRFIVFHAAVRGAGVALARAGRRWVGQEERSSLALSNAAKRVLASCEGSAARSAGTRGPTQSSRRTSRAMESRAMESRPKESRPKESHPKDSRPKESRPKDSRPMESHPKESRARKASSTTSSARKALRAPHA